MLWAPLHPEQGGQPGNERGCPDIDVKEVLAMWRESVPEDLRMKWFNIDPPPEDQIPTDGEALAALTAGSEEGEASDDEVTIATPGAESSGEAEDPEAVAASEVETPAAEENENSPPARRNYIPRRRGLFGRWR
jgi:hypothetical protein